MREWSFGLHDRSSVACAVYFVAQSFRLMSHPHGHGVRTRDSSEGSYRSRGRLVSPVPRTATLFGFVCTVCVLVRVPRVRGPVHLG